MTFESMPKKELEGLHSQLLEKYNSFKAKNLKLDMSRGKPCTQQLDLSMDMLKINDVKSSTGLECRNYGVPVFIPFLGRCRKRAGEKNRAEKEYRQQSREYAR